MNPGKDVSAKPFKGKRLLWAYKIPPDMANSVEIRTHVVPKCNNLVVIKE